VATRDEAVKRDGGERLKDLKTDAPVRGGATKRPDAPARPLQPCL